MYCISWYDLHSWYCLCLKLSCKDESAGQMFGLDLEIAKILVAFLLTLLCVQGKYALNISDPIYQYERVIDLSK